MAALVDPSAALASSRTGAVTVERSDLAVLELNGADVLRYLHSVSTQHTADLRPGDATMALLLSPKGKIEFAFRVAVLEGAVLLDTEAEAATALAERLARFVFRYDVRVGAPSPGAVSLLGPGADSALTAAGLPLPPAGPGNAVRAAGGLVAHRGELGVDLVGEQAPAALEALEQTGVARAPLEVWELLRIEHGVPRWGRELTDDVIAEEAGLLGSHVHLDKGCYPGQETVARVHNLGQVPRRLAGLRFEDPECEPPPPRTDLLAEDGRRAGQVRSAVRHPGLGTIALAYVRRTIAPGERVLAGPHAATVVELGPAAGTTPPRR
ncbi:MAG TPA: folate-binding protein [Actinomycetes bacterium]|nr:folate-binding protein [Actinomycetes bacterium]